MLDLRERTQSLSAVAGYFAFYGVGDNLLSGHGEPERLSGVPVSDNFFQMLGVQPQLGRTFTAEEVKWNGPKAVLLSHGLWTRRFASDPAHRRVGADAERRAVHRRRRPAGVVRFRVGLRAGQPLRSLLPFPLEPGDQPLGQHDGDDRPPEARRDGGAGAGRDADHRRADHARASRAQLVRRLRHAAGGSRQRPDAARASGCSPAPSASVMLIVCANLSNLLLARTAARQKEIAIRTALGAGRRRLIAQMLTEGIVLSCSGAVLGLAARGRRHARAGAPRRGQHPAARAASAPTRTALGFTLAIALVTGVVFGLAPAFQRAGGDAARRAEGRQPRLDRPPHLGAQRAGRLRDRVCLRAARRRRPADAQLRPRARRRSRLPSVAARVTVRVDPDSVVHDARADSSPTSTKCCAACARSPASRRPASPTRCRSAGIAPGARARRA